MLQVVFLWWWCCFVVVLLLLLLLFLHQVRNVDLSDSASIFTAEIWATINTVEQIKACAASTYIIFNGITFLSLGFTTYEAGTFPDLNLIWMLIQSVILKVSNKDIIVLVGYAATQALRIMKIQTLLPRLL